MDQENNKFHALQLFTDTFSAETVHLTNEAVGIYIRLLCFAWTKNARPFNTESAYRICHCINDNCKKNVNKVLNEFFKKVEDKSDAMMHTVELWTHKRLVQEHKYLTAKYKKKSDAGKKGMEIRYGSVNNKTITPIPSPIPIPKYNISKDFELFWSLINIKKGSKHLCAKKYALNCQGSDPRVIAETFNRYTSKVKDKEFVAHVATWINQKRFEDEENNKPPVEKPIEYSFEGIKLKKKGEFGEYIELYDNKGNQYKKHKFRNLPITKV